MCKLKHLLHSCIPPWVVQYMLNDTLCNPGANANGYSIRVCLLCELKSGGVSVCYISYEKRRQLKGVTIKQGDR